MAKLTEAIIRDLRTFFETNLPAKLAALEAEYEAEYQDGITLPPPAVYSYGRRTLGETQAPRLEILAPDGAGMSPTFYTADSIDALHDVEIRVVLSGRDTSTLRLALMRYMRAIWELVADRFFSSTPDDYWALHGEGDITIAYDAPALEALLNTPPYYDQATLTARFGKQEDY